MMNDHKDINTLKSYDLKNATDYYVVQELRRVLYYSVWAKCYFISRLLKWIWDNLFNRKQIRILKTRFKKYPFPVQDYLVSLQPELCKVHNLCYELNKSSAMSEAEKLEFIAGLIYKTHLLNYHPTHDDGHKLTAALIMKMGIENFCDCIETP
ncbi:MAG: hypothetical protein H0X30_09275 [Anaerolineae bacterium]|nr:hypothetical protein [Anaerolineae bacterium]